MPDSRVVKRFFDRPLILASRSPRRQHLLAEAGIETVCIPAEVQEATRTEDRPSSLAIANAELKAMAISVLRPEDIVLGADTIVVFKGQIFGKPHNYAHAVEMLTCLAGQVHEVITGVCLVKWARPVMVKFYETTWVRFRSLTTSQIQDYLASIDPFDKAGAYAAQEDGGRIIECMEGSLSNVIGLPMERTLKAIEDHFAVNRAAAPPSR